MKKIKKEHGVFWAIGSTLLLFVFNLLITTFVFLFTNSMEYAYLIGYIVPLIIIFLINKDTIIKDFKNIKKDIKGKKVKLIVAYSILMALMLTSNIILNQLIGNLSENEQAVREMFQNAPILMFFVLGIIGPIFEEFTYRFPYKNIKTNKIVKFFVYTTIFASIHIIGSTDLKSLLFIIPYFFLSSAIGYSFYKTENIFTSMFFHILNNSFSLLVVFLFS